MSGESLLTVFLPCRESPFWKMNIPLNYHFATKAGKLGSQARNAQIQVYFLKYRVIGIG